LEEGTRLVSDIVGVEPAAVRVGMPLEAEMVAFDDELTLPQFHPAPAAGPGGRPNELDVGARAPRTG
jgi:hypothetical protein